MVFRLLLPALVMAFPLAAQMPWTANLPQRGVSIDVLRPAIKDADASLLSLAAYASGRFPIGKLAVRFELPFARYAQGDFSSTTLGNPYLGVETINETGAAFELGIRAPLASEDETTAWVLGWFSDITRLEAFLPTALTVATRARWRTRNADGLTADLGGGPSLLIPTEGGDVELVLHHHLSAGYRGTSVWGAVSFGGLTALTGDGSFSERMINEIGATVGLSRGSVRPALHIILPIDDEHSSVVSTVIGFGVSMQVR